MVCLFCLPLRHSFYWIIHGGLLRKHFSSTSPCYNKEEEDGDDENEEGKDQADEKEDEVKEDDEKEEEPFSLPKFFNITTISPCNVF